MSVFILKSCYRLFLLLVMILSGDVLFAEDNNDNWLQIEPGFYQGVFLAPLKSEFGDSRITILKIDPQYFVIDIFCESNQGRKQRTLKEWSAGFGLVAAINAGMFATDHVTSVGYLKSGKHVNNPHFNKKYNCVFACSPLDQEVPLAQIIDLRCQEFSKWKDKYRSFSQSIRMISCRQKNVWQQQSRKWSIAALAMDKSGNILLIHSRSPYTVHDFIDILLELPLDIYTAMYLEGGPMASLYYFSGGIGKELVGSYETGLFLTDNNTTSWPIPNVIGVKRK